MPEPGVPFWHPEFTYGRSVNPIPTRGEDSVQTYYWHPQKFSPSGIPDYCNDRPVVPGGAGGAPRFWQIT